MIQNYIAFKKLSLQLNSLNSDRLAAAQASHLRFTTFLRNKIGAGHFGTTESAQTKIGAEKK